MDYLEKCHGSKAGVSEFDCAFDVIKAIGIDDAAVHQCYLDSFDDGMQGVQEGMDNEKDEKADSDMESEKDEKEGPEK